MHSSWQDSELAPGVPADICLPPNADDGAGGGRQPTRRGALPAAADWAASGEEGGDMEVDSGSAPMES